LCDLVVEQDQLAVFYQGAKIEGFDAVIPRVGSSVTTYGTNVMRQLEMMGTFSVTKAESMLKTRNKWLCYQILASEGIPIPKSLLPNFAQLDEQLIRSNFSEPLILKLLESTHGIGVILSESYKNTNSTIEAFYRLRESVMIQEYVREANGADIRVLVVADKIVASMKRQARDGEFRSNLHRGATAMVENLTEEEKLLARRVCKLMDLNVAGVDLLRAKAGPMVLEINSSPGLEGIETVTGIDVAGQIVKFIERQVKKRHKFLMRKA
jgi:ribosomal protein S6--L-glutamate ligase